MSSTNYSNSIPVLPVEDLEKTLRFYRDYLGFTDEWISGDPGINAGISRDGLDLLFTLNPEFVKKINTPEHRLEIYLLVTNVEEVYHELLMNGITIHSKLNLAASKASEFSVIDCNGYLLRFGEGIEYQQPSFVAQLAK